MERQLIRARWQITIPRTIRRALSLFIGQTLNFSIDEEFCMRISTGVLPSAEEVEFWSFLKGKNLPPGKGKKIRKSEASREKLLRLRATRTLAADKAKKYAATGIDWLSLEEGKAELKELLSSAARLLAELQERI